MNGSVLQCSLCSEHVPENLIEVHVREELRVAPFQCFVCGVRFYSRAAATYHFSRGVSPHPSHPQPAIAECWREDLEDRVESALLGCRPVAPSPPASFAPGETRTPAPPVFFPGLERPKKTLWTLELPTDEEELLPARTDQEQSGVRRPARQPPGGMSEDPDSDSDDDVLVEEVSKPTQLPSETNEASPLHTNNGWKRGRGRPRKEEPSSAPAKKKKKKKKRETDPSSSTLSRTYSGTKVPCPEPGCTAAFSDNYKLRRHSSMHTAVKDWSCNLCDKEYSRKERLREHQLRAHPGECEASMDEAASLDGSNVSRTRTSPPKAAPLRPLTSPPRAAFDLAVATKSEHAFSSIEQQPIPQASQ